MIITDFNKMSLEELLVIHVALGIEFEVSDGRIRRTEGDAGE